MIKKEFKGIDYLGREYTEICRFNLTEQEMVDMALDADSMGVKDAIIRSRQIGKARGTGYASLENRTPFARRRGERSPRAVQTPFAPQLPQKRRNKAPWLGRSDTRPTPSLY